MPEKVDWLLNYAKPIIEGWGYPVEVLTSDKDYMYYFWHVRQKSKYPENVGKYCGFLMGGACSMQQEKVKPIKRYLRALGDHEETVGICADEPERLERMKIRGQRSLLAELGITQPKAMEICREEGLVLPTYENEVNRDGCWFCPNQRIAGFASVKTKHPELWAELAELAKVPNVISRGFKYGVPFNEVDRKVDEYINRPIQTTVEDFLEGQK